MGEEREERRGMKEEFRTKGGIYWVGDKEARGRDSGINPTSPENGLKFCSAEKCPPGFSEQPDKSLVGF